MLKVCRLRCEAMYNPLGISVENPRLSWMLKSNRRNVKQAAFRVEVFKVDEAGEKEVIIWQREEETADNFVQMPRILKESKTRYRWSVSVTDNRGETGQSTEVAWFETGLLYEGDWKGKWIEPKQEPVVLERIGLFSDNQDEVDIESGNMEPMQSNTIDEARMSPCQMVRKTFSVSGKIRSARVYATAHGVYRLLLNGKRVGDYELAPEVTPYHVFLQVQTYDVTELLSEGENVLGAVLAPGWWAGRIGVYGDSRQYGDKMGLLLQMNITCEDGTEIVIGTDESFKSSEGPRRYAEIYIGEKYDKNQEKAGWDLPGYVDDGWMCVEIKEVPLANLVGQNAPHMKVLDILDAEQIYVSPKGEKILDFGQVMAGNATMHIKGESGARVRLYYFETADKDGNYWFELVDGRNSQQTDTFVLDESGEGDYDPWFTYHAFRYIYVSSDKGEVEVEDAKARLIASDVEKSLDIQTSNEKVNRLQKNIEWTLLSNMTSVLTDNPDRERAGWTGDLQMVAPTLCYNLDAQSFLKRWLLEAGMEQRENGEIPLVVPNWPQYAAMPMKYSAGWGDAVVIVPWILYERYGDKSILETCWPIMKKWVTFEEGRARTANPELEGKMTPEREEWLKYLWNSNEFNFGDWLTPSACYNAETGTFVYFTQVLCYLMGSYYYAYATSIMAKAADVLGMEEESRYYANLNEKTREAAIEEFYKTGKILDSEYMGAQILALHMGFYPVKDKKKLVERMLELIDERGIDTGFSSTLLIHDTLCENGYPEKAYDFLLDESFPSWLYEVNQGATTIWESMQAIMPDGTRNAVSYIQPAFCSIGNWMVQGMGGIRPAAPGFRKIAIRPYFTDRLSFVRTAYMSVQGEIVARWEKLDDKVKVTVTIPVNTTAEVTLPGARKTNVRESGVKVEEFEGLLGLAEAKDSLTVEIGSGIYCFEYEKK